MNYITIILCLSILVIIFYINYSNNSNNENFMGTKIFQDPIYELENCKTLECLKNKTKKCKEICKKYFNNSQCQLVCDTLDNEMIKNFNYEYQIFGRNYIPGSPINYNNIVSDDIYPKSSCNLYD
jgi:hypothetical protein